MLDDSPAIRCLNLRMQVVNAVAAEGHSPTEQRMVGKFCDLGCTNHQKGVSWETIDRQTPCETLL